MAGSGPKITAARKLGSAALLKRMAGLTRLSALVGVPATTAADRESQLRELASGTKNKKKQVKASKAAKNNDVNNAELLYLFSKGSPLRNQPPRPVLEPAVAADGNRQAIAHELALAGKATLAGDRQEAIRRTKRAGIAGQNAARNWFTDGRNGWAPNAPSTIEGKGSDRPGIDTGAMRNAITNVLEEK